MNKSQKEKINNLYYMKPVTNVSIDEEKEEKKKIKEREKRIKERKKKQVNEEEKFDLDTETVIGMTKKNHERDKNIEKKIVDKNERKRLKKIKRIKRIIKWTAIIVIIAGGTTFAMVSPMFNIQDIQVNNVNRISADTVISLSGLTKGQNIFRFFTNNIEENIKQEPYVDSVEVKRVLPNKIQIEVTERVPRFCVQVLNSLAYINSQGYILEISQNELALPIITGIRTPEENIKEGNRLEEDDLICLEEVLKIMNIAKENNLDTKVTSIDISQKNEYSMTMQEEKKTIYLGDTSNLSAKMVYIQGILEDNKDKEVTIYVNGDFNKKFRPYFREKVTT